MRNRKVSESPRKIRPAFTPDAREKQMIALAVDLAEKQLREGTASSQVITHYLRLGSSKEKAELEKLKAENELLRIKAESIQAAQRDEELYEKVLEAMWSYSGKDDDYEDL